MNIPLFRAECILIPEIYHTGLAVAVDINKNQVWIRTGGDTIKCCHLDTLSITFPNMEDSQRKSIFASLNKSGKGGDIVNKTTRHDSKDCVAKFSSIGAHLEAGEFNIPLCRSLTLKIIGIKE